MSIRAEGSNAPVLASKTTDFHADKVLAALWFVFLFGGCATLWYGNPHGTSDVVVHSNPEGAELAVDDSIVGQTPVVVQVDHKSTFSREMRLRKLGFAPTTAYLSPRTPWEAYAVDCCLLANPVAFLVDLRSGAGRFPHRLTVKLLTWLEYVRGLVSQTQSADPDRVEGAIDDLARLTEEAIEAVPFLIESYPICTVSRLSRAVPPGLLTDFGAAAADAEATDTAAAVAGRLRDMFGKYVRINYGLAEIRESRLLARTPVNEYGMRIGKTEVYEAYSPEDVRFTMRTQLLGGSQAKEVFGRPRGYYFINYTVHIGAYALKAITGQDIGTDQNAWREWWKSKVK